MAKKILLSFVLIGFASYAVASQEHKENKTKDRKSKAVEFPTDMERNYDELLQSWATNANPKTECDYTTTEAILCPDSVYIRRLYALPSRMELAFNPIVKQFIEMYANRRRGQVSYMLGLGNYYFPMFEEELDKEGLPLELKYLPVIESALNPVARSRAGATGLWQFMSATGKLYKLEINSLVDERRDPYRATQAAVKYLKDMYAIYQDWNLVIAAYNCGPGNVNKAIARSGGKRDYWEIYPYLPKETRGYVPAFIAATYIMNYYPEHNICPGTANLPSLIDTLSIDKTVHFEQIAEILKIPTDDIRKLNPQFNQDIIPGEYKPYALKLPISQLSAFIGKKDEIYAHRADELLTHKRIREVAAGGNAPASGGYATHRVKRGDTLGAIAMRYRTSVAQLKNWNGMRSDNLSVGQNLKVSAYVPPRKEPVTKPDNVRQEKTTEFVVDNGTLKKTTIVTKTITSNYEVKKGDNWAGIAQQTGASAADIKSWNGIRNNKLIAGKILKIHKTETVEELSEIAKPKNVALNSSPDALSFDAYIEGLDLDSPTTSLGILNPSGSGDYDAEEEKKNGGREEDDEKGGAEQVLAVYHKVVYGETLSQIAEKYNVTVEEILNWNNISKSNSSNVTKLLIILPHEEDSKNV